MTTQQLLGLGTGLLMWTLWFMLGYKDLTIVLFTCFFSIISFIQGVYLERLENKELIVKKVECCKFGEDLDD